MWEKINKFVYSHVILSVLLLGILFMLAILAVGILIMLDMQPTIGLTLFTTWQIVLTCIVVFLMWKLQVFNIGDFKFKNMGKGFLLGWLFIVLSVILFLLNLMQLPEDSIIKPNPLYLLIVILHPFIGTGLFEEVLVRGLLLKLLLKKMGHTKR